VTKQMLNLRGGFLSFIFFFLCSPALIHAGAAGGLIIEHGPRTIPSIALTFDACPTDLLDEYDERVVEILLKEDVPATIFMSGRWVEKHPDKAIFLAGKTQFELAAHSFYHPHLLEKDDGRVLREMRRTQAIIKKVTGRTPEYFRPPYGEVDDRVATLAKTAGLTTINYDIASGDPDPSLSPERIARSVLRGAKDGSIIVFHLNCKGVHTAEALPRIIEGLRKKGFKLVTVGEMLKDDTQEVTTRETRNHEERSKINNR
jgi:peptidoglycan/xylan/chitin deacetylase (PgdA/CDA1 family)